MFCVEGRMHSKHYILGADGLLKRAAHKESDQDLPSPCNNQESGRDRSLHMGGLQAFVRIRSLRLFTLTCIRAQGACRPIQPAVELRDAGGSPNRIVFRPDISCCHLLRLSSIV